MANDDTHFGEKCHRRPFGRKCVGGREEESALEGPGRQVRRREALRTSAKSATEGRLGGSALQGGRRNVPQKGLGGRFGEGRHYALPRNVPQMAVLTEVRCRAGGGMCPGGAWEAGSATGGATHFREMCHRRPF